MKKYKVLLYKLVFIYQIFLHVLIDVVPALAAA